MQRFLRKGARKIHIIKLGFAQSKLGCIVRINIDSLVRISNAQANYPSNKLVLSYLADVKSFELVVCLTFLFGCLSTDKPNAQSPIQHDAPFSPKHYICQYTNEQITIDGQINETPWEKAPWSTAFVDIEGDQKPIPRHRTRFKMVYDSSFLYIVAKLEEPHLWATLKQKDTVIYYNNDFEVFIDPDGDTHNYMELEVNAFNTIWDLFLTKPYRDEGNKVFNEWGFKGLKTAVSYSGTLNVPSDIDSFWIVEMALDFESMEPHTSQDIPPKFGDYWRINFSRVQWDLQPVNGKYQVVRYGKDHDEHNWVWSPQGQIAMHMPEFWGFVVFVDEANSQQTFELPSDEWIKWDLRQLYYEQHQYFETHGKFYESSSKNLPLQYVDQTSLKISTSATTFEMSYPSSDQPGQWWHIRHDGQIFMR